MYECKAFKWSKLQSIDEMNTRPSDRSLCFLSFYLNILIEFLRNIFFNLENLTSFLENLQVLLGLFWLAPLWWMCRSASVSRMRWRVSGVYKCTFPKTNNSGVWNFKVVYGLPIFRYELLFYILQKKKTYVWYRVPHIPCTVSQQLWIIWSDRARTDRTWYWWDTIQFYLEHRLPGI